MMRRKSKPKAEPPILSASGAHILTEQEGKIANDSLNAGTDPWLSVALVRVVGRAGDVGVAEDDLFELVHAEVIRMSMGLLMAEGRLTEEWNGSDFAYREAR